VGVQHILAVNKNGSWGTQKSSTIKVKEKKTKKNKQRKKGALKYVFKPMLAY